MKEERVEKIRSLLYRELSYYIKTKMNIEDFQITKVLLSPDLKKAKFFFIIYSSDQDKGKVEEFLNRNSKRIRNDLFRILRLRVVPYFIFEYDRGCFM